MIDYNQYSWYFKQNCWCVVLHFRTKIVEVLNLKVLKDPIFVNICLGQSFVNFSDITFFVFQPMLLFQYGYDKVSIQSQVGQFWLTLFSTFRFYKLTEDICLLAWWTFHHVIRIKVLTYIKFKNNNRQKNMVAKCEILDAIFAGIDMFIYRPF